MASCRVVPRRDARCVRRRPHPPFEFDWAVNVCNSSSVFKRSSRLLEFCIRADARPRGRGSSRGDIVETPKPEGINAFNSNRIF